MYQPLAIPNRRVAHPFPLWALVILTCAASLLGCDDQAEPTTPESPLPAAVAAESQDAAASAPGVAAITLPVDQSIATTAPAPAFRVTQTGTGPDGIFRISKTTNGQTALLGQTNGTGTAVRGLSTGTGSAGRFEITNVSSGNTALSGRTNGVGFAVHGLSTGTGPGGRFEITNSSNGSAALTGQSAGRGFAVVGRSTGTGPAGYFEVAGPSSGSPALAAYTAGVGPAASFQTDHVNAAVTLSVENTNGSDLSSALEAIHKGSGYAAIFGCRTVAPTCGKGVFIRTQGEIALSVVGGLSAVEDLNVNGTLRKSAGSFRIDHPLDPEHKYLSHSFVESPDMLNVYNGNATLDGKGEAVVLLPGYFEVLNRDFRYQLTPIGAPGPDLHIAEEINVNRFVIAGGTPGARVSWQVTGVRQDAYAEAHRIQVEEDKPAAETGVALRP